MSNDPTETDATPRSILDVQPQDLQMAWNNPQAVMAQGASGNAPSTSSDLQPDINVSIPGLTTAEQSMIDTSSNIVAAYRQLYALVVSSKSFIFGQNAGGTKWNNPWAAVGNALSPAPSSLGNAISDTQAVDPIADAAKKFAGVVNPQMDNLLKQVSDLMVVVGQYIGVIDDARSAYATAEKNSNFPSAESTGSTMPSSAGT